MHVLIVLLNPKLPCYTIISRDLRSFEFKSAVPIWFNLKVMGRFQNFWIGRACPLLVAVKRLKPLTALGGTVYRLASSMSDHTPVLFIVFEYWNEESVVPHISFVSFVINYWLLNVIFIGVDSIQIRIVTPDSFRIRLERKRPIRRSLIVSWVWCGQVTCGQRRMKLMKSRTG